VKFGVESTEGRRQISSPSVEGWRCGPQNWKFYAISEYERPSRACPLGDFYEIL